MNRKCIMHGCIVFMSILLFKFVECSTHLFSGWGDLNASLHTRHDSCLPMFVGKMLMKSSSGARHIIIISFLTTASWCFGLIVIAVWCYSLVAIAMQCCSCSLLATAITVSKKCFSDKQNTYMQYLQCHQPFSKEKKSFTFQASLQFWTQALISESSDSDEVHTSLSKLCDKSL